MENLVGKLDNQEADAVNAAGNNKEWGDLPDKLGGHVNGEGEESVTAPVMDLEPLPEDLQALTVLEKVGYVRVELPLRARGIQYYINLYFILLHFTVSLKPWRSVDGAKYKTLFHVVRSYVRLTPSLP